MQVCSLQLCAHCSSRVVNQLDGHGNYHITPSSIESMKSPTAWLLFTAFHIFFIEIFHAESLASSHEMASNSLRQRLLQGGKSYGPMILSDSSIVAEVLGGIGYGHIVLDMEHSPSNLQSCQRLLQALDASSAYSGQRSEPIVRLESPHDTVAVKKILDSMCLPGGILVPMVEDAETAEKIVRAVRYPLQINDNRNQEIDGIRGCAVPFVRASGYGYVSNEEYLRQCNDDLLLMVQVETPKAVDAIPEIASVEGIDVIFLGPFDLSASAGKMGDFSDPDVQSLIARAEKAILQSPCLLGGFRPPGVALSEMFEKGYRFICGAVDIGLLREAARLDVRNGQDAIKRQ